MLHKPYGPRFDAGHFKVWDVNQVTTLTLRVLEATGVVCILESGIPDGNTLVVVTPCSGAYNNTRSGCRQIWFV